MIFGFLHSFILIVELPVVYDIVNNNVWKYGSASLVPFKDKAVVIG